MHLRETASTRIPRDQHDIDPNQFYDWLKDFFENGHVAFDNGRKAKAVEDAKDKKIQLLEAKLARKNEVMAEFMEAHNELKKKSWGTLTRCWLPHDTRDQIVDFVRSWSDKTDIPVARFVPWLSKYYDWIQRFGKVNAHNAWVPRAHWLTAAEHERLRAFARANPLEGYRRLTFRLMHLAVAEYCPPSVASVATLRSIDDSLPTSVDGTLLISLRENAIAKEPGVELF